MDNCPKCKSSWIGDKIPTVCAFFMAQPIGVVK